MSHNSDPASITSPLALTMPPPLTEHPAAVYLAGLGAGSNRIVVLQGLVFSDAKPNPLVTPMPKFPLWL